jgi:hypothetical protein
VKAETHRRGRGRTMIVHGPMGALQCATSGVFQTDSRTHTLSRKLAICLNERGGTTYPLAPVTTLTFWVLAMMWGT